MPIPPDLKEQLGQLVFWSIFAVGVIGLILGVEAIWGNK